MTIPLKSHYFSTMERTYVSIRLSAQLPISGIFQGRPIKKGPLTHTISHTLKIWEWYGNSMGSLPIGCTPTNVPPMGNPYISPLFAVQGYTQWSNQIQSTYLRTNQHRETLWSCTRKIAPFDVSWVHHDGVASQGPGVPPWEIKPKNKALLREQRWLITPH